MGCERILRSFIILFPRRMLSGGCISNCHLSNTPNWYIRKQSDTYGKCFSIELDDQKAYCLYIPAGFAHGFLSLEDDSIVNYSQTSCYSKGHDCGIAHDSIGFDWGIENPIISSRDLTFGTLKQLKTPF